MGFFSGLSDIFLGSDKQESETKVKLPKASETENALMAQFLPWFGEGGQFNLGDQIQSYMGGMKGAGGGGVSYGGGTASIGTIPVGTPGGDTQQMSYDQLLGNYVGGTDQAFKEFQAGAIQAWNDWMAFEDKYDNLYEAIGPVYDQIVSEYKQNIDSIPGLNLGLPGGGSIPLAPKVHSNMYSQQANTEAGIQNQKFGQQGDALKGTGIGIAGRTSLLPSYYAAGADNAGTNLNAANSLLTQQKNANDALYQQGALANQSNAMNIAAKQAAAQAEAYPIELAKWILQSERGLRTNQPTTQMKGTAPTDGLLSTLIPAAATVISGMMGMPGATSGLDAGVSGFTAPQVNTYPTFMNQNWGVM